MEGFFDLFESGFHYVVLWITGPCGVCFFGKGPAGPGARFALFAAGFFEAIRVVLKMDARIADKDVCRCVGHEPLHGGVGKWVLREDGFIACEVGTHGAIQAEHGARGELLLPEVMTVFEAGVIKLGSSFLLTELIQAPPIEIRTRLGQIRAGR